MATEIKTEIEALVYINEIINNKINILKSLNDSSTYIDDRTGNEEKIYAIANTTAAEDFILIYESSKFCLNRIYLGEDDNKLHLSEYSAGGTMNTENKDIEDAVEEYNKEAANYKQIKTIYFSNGDVKKFIK